MVRGRSMQNDGKNARTIQSVDRALSLLSAFTMDTPHLSLTEMCARAGLNVSTGSRLATSLMKAGVLHRDPITDRFTIGSTVLRLAAIATSSSSLRDIAHPLLEELVIACRDTVSLAVFNGDEVINIDQVAGIEPVRYAGWIGRHYPLHCTAGGRLFLAFAPTLLDEVLSHELAAYTTKTITDPGQLCDAVARVRDEGIAIVYDELDEGLTAIGAPILDRAQCIVAAVGVSLPSFRAQEDRLSFICAQTRRVAQEISHRLGTAEREVSTFHHRRAPHHSGVTVVEEDACKSAMMSPSSEPESLVPPLPII